MGPLQHPPPPPAGPLYQFNSVLGNTLSTIHSCIVGWVLFCVFTVFGITVEPPLTATSLQSIHSLLFQPLYNGHFFLSPRWPLQSQVQLYSKLLVIANVHNTKKLPLSFQVNINGILISVTPMQVFFRLITEQNVCMDIYNNTMPHRMLAHTSDDGLSVLL